MFNDIAPLGVLLKERHIECIKLLHSLNVDVICLQEVLNEYISVFINALAEKYIPVVTSFQPIGRRYGELIFVRKGISILNWRRTELPSTMGRQLLHVQIYTNSRVYNIITFHLESLDSAVTRAQQLQILWNEYGHMSNMICIGDTNIKSGEIVMLPPRFYDSWHPTVAGYEYTSWGHRYWNNNLRERYDRMWLTKNLRVDSLRSIGTEPFSEGKWISDHDGLFAILS